MSINVNPHAEYRQAACRWCKEGVAMSDAYEGLHCLFDSMDKYDSRAGMYPKCTAPTEAQHIERLTARVAELEAKLETSQRIYECNAKQITGFGAEVQRHEEEMANLKAANTELRTTLELRNQRVDELNILGLDAEAANAVLRTADPIDYEAQYKELIDALCSPSWMGRTRHSSVLGLAIRLRDSQRKLYPSGLNNDDARVCIREAEHDSPCNGFPRTDCLAAAREALKAGPR